ncbi:tRNA proofreading protein [Klebsiella pneumoniae]|nr:tRNA proofreading protein [Klebsiella pneumoniae]
MSLQSVRQFFAEHAPDIEIIEFRTATSPPANAAIWPISPSVKSIV